MALKAIYKITVTNWTKYNPKRKKSYRMVMISERFLDDAKIQSLTPVTRLLFLSCILSSSQSDQGQCEVTHESLRSQSGVKSQSIQSQLDLLQSLQLLTYEKFEVLLNRNEMNRNEMKRKEENVPWTKSATISPPHDQTVFENLQEENQSVDPIEIWKEFHGPLPAVKNISETRKRKANAQAKLYPDRDHWLEVLEHWTGSTFCLENWRPGIDEFLNEEKRLRTIEGKYDDKNAPTASFFTER